MNWKRRLLLLWLAASLAWIVFAFLQFLEPQLDGFAWTAWDILDCLTILLGLPLACLGGAIAIMWIPWDGGR